MGQTYLGDHCVLLFNYALFSHGPPANLKQYKRIETKTLLHLFHSLQIFIVG